ncbi:TPA: type 1 fimbrial protein [Klebsiella quasipneumoniae subsp. similipneumoniae]|nr:type 1 fimbrial protein [Klebsiella quasipneumoniae subsp. similipneumoniae]HBT4805289.1 type 1 fimbrial protein [Klebsiella quasipneumoniae subsp. similipneumoniae]
MNKHSICIAIVAAASLTAASAMAGGAGQINFNGSITDVACTIVNTPSNPLDVPLGTYGSNEFKAVGDSTAKKDVKIALSDCPATVTSASVIFDGANDPTNADLLALTTEEGVATGIGIQLYDKDQAEVALHTASKAYALEAGNNTLPFYAAYKSTAAAVTPGSANGVANFSIIYN